MYGSAFVALSFLTLWEMDLEPGASAFKLAGHAWVRQRGLAVARLTKDTLVTVLLTFP